MKSLPIGWWLVPLVPRILWRAQIVHAGLEQENPGLAALYPYWVVVRTRLADGTWSMGMSDHVAVPRLSQFRLREMEAGTYALWQGLELDDVEGFVDLPLRLDPPDAHLAPGQAADLFASEVSA